MARCFNITCHTGDYALKNSYLSSLRASISAYCSHWTNPFSSEPHLTSQKLPSTPQYLDLRTAIPILVTTSNTHPPQALGSQPKDYFSGLAPELLLKVFESLDSHQEITALNITSVRFHDIWYLHTASISTAVLSRSIDCFDDAQELLKMKKKATPHDGDLPRRQITLQRNRILVTNANLASLAESEIGRNVLDRGEKILNKRLFNDIYTESNRPAQCTSERKVFIYIYYRLWIAAMLASKPLEQWDHLEAVSHEELRGMDRMALCLGKQYCSFGNTRLPSLEWICLKVRIERVATAKRILKL